MGGSVTVALVGGKELAKELGKKGTASDLTLFNSVRDDHAVTIVEPTQFPEKLAPLFEALAMADRCLLAIVELTRPVAEAMAVVDLSDVPTTIVLGSGVGEAELGKVLKGSRLESVPRVPLDYPALRTMLEGWTAPMKDGPVEVPIDHSFPVKGVGAVALGVVRRGTLHAHDRLRLFPTGKDVDVRSIQVHDADRKEAACGERVGVALRGVDAEEISRGQVLAAVGSLQESPTVVGGPLTRCRYYRGDAAPGAQLHLALGLQVVPASLDRSDPTGVAVTADRPVAIGPGATAFLLDLSVPAGPRVFGRFTTTGAPAP
jgi:selenocysteine-specific translation elongation factor